MPAWPDFRTGVRLPPPPPASLQGGGSLCLPALAESSHSRARNGGLRRITFGRGVGIYTPQTPPIDHFSLCFSETFGLPLTPSEGWWLTARGASDLVRRSYAWILRLFERQRQNRIDKDILSVKWTLATPLEYNPDFSYSAGESIIQAFCAFSVRISQVRCLNARRMSGTVTGIDKLTSAAPQIV